MILGVTGGIASGKSTATARLRDALGAVVFDADATARALVDDDPGVREQLRAEFGAGILGVGGRVDRAALRAVVFADPARKRVLEAMVHPLVRAVWVGMAEDHLQKPRSAPLILDIPLLYETGADSLIDRVVVVGCRCETQLQRLVKIRQLDEAIARQIIASQLPLSEKAARCQHLLWNEGSLASILAQVDLLAAHLRPKLSPA